jgi:hypothetical protein
MRKPDWALTMNACSSVSETQARRTAALAAAMSPIAAFLADDRVVEILLNADGAVWVEAMGVGLFRTEARMGPAEAERMLRLIASEMRVELNASSPSLSAKLPLPWSARVQASIPPIVDAPIFALRKPARIVFSLDDYVARSILSPDKRHAVVQAVRRHDNILSGAERGEDGEDATLSAASTVASFLRDGQRPAVARRRAHVTATVAPRSTQAQSVRSECHPRLMPAKRRHPRCPTAPSARRGRRVPSRRHHHSSRGFADSFSVVEIAVGPSRRALRPLLAPRTRTRPASPRPWTEPVRSLSP